jgi:dolichol-phosphate mannosyltransferase
VVLPTYNEVENLPKIVPLIEETLKGIRHEIIVADDNSPDGTYARAMELAESNPHLKAICRTHNKGLSASVMDGFAIAQGDLLVVMDADLQHDAAVLPKFLAEYANGASLVIGSRKSEGGSVQGWSALRRFVSWGATFLAKILLPGLPSDPMSGFFGIRAALYRKIAPSLNPRGFKILLEIIANAPGEPIAEVGYVFKTRQFGESKLSGAIMWSYLVALYDLRFGRFFPVRYIKYSLVGLAGWFINQLALFFLKTRLGLANEIALLPSIEIALIFNFFINNAFTFRDHRLRGVWPILKGLATYQVICVLGAYINYAVALHLVTFVGVNIYAANTAGILLASLWNYYINAQIIWNK